MNLRLILLVVLFLAVAVWADTLEPKCEFLWQDTIAMKKNLNVLDYFLLLPSSILNCENPQQDFKTAKERLTLPTKIDIKNGYISFFKAAELTLFKNRKNNIDIIALQIGKCGAGSTCGGTNSLMQFQRTSRKWALRNDLLPNGCTHEELYEKHIDQNICPYFKLPATGLVISVKDESTDSTLEQFEWDGTKFTRLWK
jgi:hypothetical protein